MKIGLRGKAMTKNEHKFCTTDLRGIAEFNRIILNYKKMDRINEALDRFIENSVRIHNEKVFKNYIGKG